MSDSCSIIRQLKDISFSESQRPPRSLSQILNDGKCGSLEAALILAREKLRYDPETEDRNSVKLYVLRAFEKESKFKPRNQVLILSKGGDEYTAEGFFKGLGWTIITGDTEQDTINGIVKVLEEKTGIRVTLTPSYIVTELPKKFESGYQVDTLFSSSSKRI